MTLASAVLRTIKFRLLSTTKGKYYRVIVTSTGAVYLWGRPRVLASRSEKTRIGPAARCRSPRRSQHLHRKSSCPSTPTSDRWTKSSWASPYVGHVLREVSCPSRTAADVFPETKVPMHRRPKLYEWLDVPVGAYVDGRDSSGATVSAVGESAGSDEAGRDRRAQRPFPAYLNDADQRGRAHHCQRRRRPRTRAGSGRGHARLRSGRA